MLDGWMDGWMGWLVGCMTCDFTSFSTVLYQDDGSLCAMETRLRLKSFPPTTGLELGTARSVGH